MCHLTPETLQISLSFFTIIQVWDLSMQGSWSSIACRVTMTGHHDMVRCIQVDDDKVVSGSYDRTLKVWDIRTGQCRLTLRWGQDQLLKRHNNWQFYNCSHNFFFINFWIGFPINLIFCFDVGLGLGYVLYLGWKSGIWLVLWLGVIQISIEF